MTQYLKAVSRETAKMSYPGRMGGVVKAGTKAEVEKYFVSEFPIQSVWTDAHKVAQSFDDWHRERVVELGARINHLVKRTRDQSEAVAAKFLNTYMHQLMKFGECQPLWTALHLPLDRRVFEALTRLHSPVLQDVDEILRKPPYSIHDQEYGRVQKALLRLIEELNTRPQTEIKLKSRIELNVLWAG
ncbi:MAG: hypothetical protein ACLP1Y_13095 [Candidatus Acidiferrales bacterium]